jgi:hypothetical protein
MLLSLNSSKTCFITFTYKVLYFPPSQLCIIHVTSERSFFYHCVFMYLQNVCMWQHFYYDLCLSLRWDSSAVHILSLDSICLLSTKQLYSFLHEIGWSLFFLGGFMWCIIHHYCLLEVSWVQQLYVRYYCIWYALYMTVQQELLLLSFLSD